MAKKNEEPLVELVDGKWRPVEPKKRKKKTAKKKKGKKAAPNKKAPKKAPKKKATAPKKKRKASGYKLVDAEKMHREHPRTFGLLGIEDRGSLRPGDWAKLGFMHRGDSERMWVRVTRVTARSARGAKYTGRLDNEPMFIPLNLGDVVPFESKHILAAEIQ